VIGKSRPIGLCGSGLITAISELLRVGVIEPSGRLKPSDEIKDARLAARIVEDESGRKFVLSREPLIAIRQGDIREVQLGKAAISAGIKVLTSIAGLEATSEWLWLLVASDPHSGQPASSVWVSFQQASGDV